MGNALTGTKGQPVFNTTPSTVADLQADADYAALVGNRKAGTASQRSALTGVTLWDGLRFYETDTKTEYLRFGSTWKAWSSDWISYTPTLTNVTVGTGGSAASVFEYKYTNGRITVRYRIILGSSGPVMGTAPTFTLPLAATTPFAQYQWLSGKGSAYDASAAGVSPQTDHRFNILSTAQVIIVLVDGYSTIANITATVPFTWASSDVLTGELTYDPA